MRVSFLRAAAVCTVLAAATIAATSTAPDYLTVRRVAELTGSAPAPKVQAYRVTVSGIGSSTLPATRPEGQVESVRELLFPTHFAPPHVVGSGQIVPLVPSVPTSFGKIDVGWTVHFDVNPHGKLIELAGAAAFVEADLLPAGYGPVAGPIYTDRGGALLSANRVEQPRAQTTTTHFDLFALPGETYEVTLYRGTKAEQHRITVTTE